MTRALALMALLAAPLGLAGCGGAPKPPPPPVLDLSISAGAAQNPETDGHPAPVSIKLFQLAGTGAFQRVDAYALLGNEAAVLGPDLLGSETVLIGPGEKQELHRPLKAGAAFLGVAVLFRDIDHAQWRAVAPLAPSGPTALKLTTAKLSMTLAP